MAQPGVHSGWRHRVLHWAIAGVLGLGIVAACTTARDLGPVDGGEGMPPVMPSIYPCDEDDNLSDEFYIYWTCNQQVKIGQTGTGPDLSGIIAGVAGSWSLGEGMPSFSYATSGTSFNVERHGTSSYYCGYSTEGVASSTIHLYPYTNANCTGRPTGTAERVLFHEIGHKVGFGDWYDGAGVNGYSEHCTMALPLGGDGRLSADYLCGHEREEAYYKYHVRGNAPSWSAYLVEGAIMSVPDSVFVNDSVTAQMTHLRVGRSTGASLCPGGWGGEGYRCIGVGSATWSWTWQGAPSGVVSLGGQTATTSKVYGVTVGGATVKATITNYGGNQITTTYFANGLYTLGSLTVVAPTLSTVSGSGQTGVVSLPLTDSVVVRLLYNGAPVAGRTVTFAISAGGGTISRASVATDAGGYARAQWTMPGTTGNKGASATVTGALNSPQNFTATAVTLTAPTSFSRNACNLYEGEAGDTLIEQGFAWTAAAIPAWEVGMASTNNSALASVIGSGTSGQVFFYGPHAKGGYPTGNRYFFIRAVFGASRSAWQASSNNPINVTGSVVGCQW